MSHKKWFATLGAVFVCSQAYAGGLQLHEQNTSGLGNAYAGSSALAEDASTGFFNPAGLPELKHTQLLLSGAMINLNTDVSFKQSTSNYLTAPGAFVAVPGNTRNEAGGWFLIPAFHASMPFSFLDRRWSVGLGVTTPFGLTTSYTEDSMARYQTTYSNLMTFNIGPSVGLQITDYLSIGAGFDAQYATAELNSRVPINPALSDGNLVNNGDDWGYGWNVGLLLKTAFGTRVGLSYRSRVNHSLEGDVSLAAQPVANLNGSLRADVTLPDYLNLSVVHDLNEQWTLMGSLEFIHWDLVDTITLNYSGPITANVNKTQLSPNFENTYRAALAVNYKPNYHWKFRVGMAYDETPIPNAKSRTFRLPDEDRVWLGLGTQYVINKCFAIDASYAHLFIDRTDIDQTQSTHINSGFDIVSHTTGQNKSSVNQFGLQLTWNIV